MFSPVYILSIETSTSVCSVSLSDRGAHVSSRESNEANIHASRLTILIQELLVESGLKFEDLAAVAVSKGPGSYTGLRIGVSVAKGLCYALDIPLLALNTLLAFAYGFVERNSDLVTESLLCPMIDARRMEVYSMVLKPNFEVLTETSAVIIDKESFQEYHTQRISLFGSGADKFVTFFEDNPNVQVLSGFLASATYLDKLAFDKFVAFEFEDVAYFEPFYLKDFVATTPKKLI